jgi:Zn finger protein HypA/HybF involved in hydrogenase expression
VSKKVKSCRTCHKGKYHAVQRTPLKSACTKCHRSANHHANGFQCTLCHRRAVHATRPSAINY